MAHIVSMDEINNFLPREKLDLQTLPLVGGQPKDHNLVESLETQARSIVHAKLRNTYDVDTWLAHATIPPLVRTIISLWVAGTVYDRQYAEESAEGVTYGAKKIKEAYMLLDGLCEGLYELDDRLYDNVAPSVFESDPVFEMRRVF